MKAPRAVGIVTAVALLCLLVSAEAQQRSVVTDPAQGHKWQDAARKEKLTDAEIAHLEKEKLLITNVPFKQVFSAYLFAEVPFFITSDSLLNAYHVLLEESIFRWEQVNAKKLPVTLRHLWDQLDRVASQVQGWPELAATAKKRAKLVLGVALQLLGDKTFKPDAELVPLIQAEAQRITKAQGQGKPEWLGPPDPGFLALDYTRFQPRGFYARMPRLQRYFRALHWLQTVPFRLDRDDEWLAIMLLGECLDPYLASFNPKAGIAGMNWEREQFFGHFARMLGQTDDPNLATCDLIPFVVRKEGGEIKVDGGYVIGDRQLWEKERKETIGKMERKEERPRINDQLALVPSDPSHKAELTYRIISSYRLPDAAMFQHTTDPRRLGTLKRIPTGMELCVMLGSSYARKQLANAEGGKLLPLLGECAPLFGDLKPARVREHDRPVYADYLSCLSALFTKPESDAAAFMNSEAWQIKSCQTALSSWAQMRHTWVLQAKQVASFGGLPNLPPGFIEANPEFFARASLLVENTIETLRYSDALNVESEEIVDLRLGAETLEQLATAQGKNQEKSDLKNLQWHLYNEFRGILHVLNLGQLKPETPAYYQEAALQLRKLAEKIDRDEPLEDRTLEAALRKRGRHSIAAEWHLLERVSRRLETLLQKQFRGVPFTDEERAFILNYGGHLGNAMLYAGNSYLMPNDDAPRIADVFHRTLNKQHLLVGISRPRALYVLHPWKGGEVLCRGAVLPYYELTHPDRLSDAAWMSMLDSPQRPEQPAWIKPIVTAGGLTAPKWPE